ncbi:MAG: hypothetical protein AAFR58_25235 [Cyanobacteria bacterium J06627_28]
MTDRLDSIESQQKINTANIGDLVRLSENVLLAAERNLETINKNAKAAERNLAEIERNSAKIERNSAKIERNSAAIAESDTRFNILIQEMRADRRAFLQAIESLNSRVDNLEQTDQ